MAVNIGVNIQRSANRIAQAVRESGVGGKYPELLLDFDDGYYRANGGSKPLSEVVTHSRAGNATMVDSDGLIKWAPHNLKTYSEDFDNAEWTKAGCSLVTAVAPDGSLTARKIQEDSSSGPHGIFANESVTSGVTYTASVYAKAGEYDYLRFGFGQGLNSLTGTYFDLQNGTIVNDDGTQSITPAGNGWYRCTVTGVANNSTGSNVILYNSPDGTSFSYTGDGTSGIYIWGAQLYRSDLGGMAPVPAGERSFPSASTYVPTTSSARYLPRVGHHVYNGSAWVNEGVLAESEARTNLLPYSSEFDNADWGKFGGAVIIADQAASPDGEINADQFYGSSGAHVIDDVSASAGTSYTASLFVKSNGTDQIDLNINYRESSAVSINYFGARFDLSTETVTNSTPGFGLAADSATLQNIGGGWYRIAVSKLAPVNTTVARFYLRGNTASTVSDGFFIYGAQLEAAPTPSSYIPTAGSTVTRAAETFTIPAANLPWPTETYGPELMTNGTFDSDVSGWAKVNPDSVITYSSGEMALSENGNVTAAGALQELTLVIGKAYLATCHARAGSSTSVSLRLLNNAETGFLGQSTDSTSTSSSTLSFVFVATETNSKIYARLGGSSSAVLTGYFDNVSVRELTRYPVSIQMNGRMTYADEGDLAQIYLIYWNKDADNSIRNFLSTSGSATGLLYFRQEALGVIDSTQTADNAFSPGILVPFNIASRHGMTFVNGAVDGVALTANTTPTNLPDLSATDLNLAYDYSGTIKTFRIWDKDIGDAGLVEATEPSLEPSLNLIFDSSGSSFIVDDWA
jgi:hypothetical protein